MKKHLSLVLAAVLGFLPCLASETFKVEEKQTIEKTLTPADPSSPVSILVDNLFGSIEVEGTRAEMVELVARKTVKARDRDKIRTAEAEVSLDISQNGNAFEFYVDGPFRDKDEDGWRRRHRDPGYRVEYDFVLKVPQRAEVVLKTVTGGDISVNNIEGPFDVRNVNGKITLTAMAGYGKAHTVNGPVKVDFSRNPMNDCSFKTINGDVSLSFSGSLSADFWLKTFHGDALTDYQVTHLPPRPVVKKKEDSRFVFKSDRFTGVRVGQGGPAISMDTLNGDLLINKK